MAIAPISLTKPLVFPDEAALPRIGLALSRAYLPEAVCVTCARSPSRSGWSRPEIP